MGFPFSVMGGSWARPVMDGSWSGRFDPLFGLPYRRTPLVRDDVRLGHGAPAPPDVRPGHGPTRPGRRCLEPSSARTEPTTVPPAGTPLASRPSGTADGASPGSRRWPGGAGPPSTSPSTYGPWCRAPPDWRPLPGSGAPARDRRVGEAPARHRAHPARPGARRRAPVCRRSRSVDPPRSVTTNARRWPSGSAAGGGVPGASGPAAR